MLLLCAILPWFNAGSLIERLDIMNKKDVTIKIVNLDRLSYIEKRFTCNGCQHDAIYKDTQNCPLFRHIVSEVTQTSYNIVGSKINITASTYEHDFRRALNVVRNAIEAQQCCKH